MARHRIKRSLPQTPEFASNDPAYGTALLRAVCSIAGAPSYVDDVHEDLEEAGVVRAVQQHDSRAIFAWTVRILSRQGIADQVAAAFIERHGSVEFCEVEKGASIASCEKLASFWDFSDCGYRKNAARCNQPDLFSTCSLPQHPLRNGHLNQLAYSLFFFIRDIANGDLVQWLDNQLAHAEASGAVDRRAVLTKAVVEPLSGVYGASNKVLRLVLAELCLGAGQDRGLWKELGVNLIVVDTLVHNFLHRTGLLQRYGTNHAYGPACYGPAGCESVLHTLASRIDCRAYNPSFPALFPRFVQHAVWRYCSQSHFDVCNGNQIDDRKKCDLKYICRLYAHCDKNILSNNSVL